MCIHVRRALASLYLCNIMCMYFRSSIMSLSGLWDQELAQLRLLLPLASSPAFPPSFRTAVALLLSVIVTV